MHESLTIFLTPINPHKPLVNESLAILLTPLTPNKPHKPSGMKPLLFSVADAVAGKPYWRRAGTNICYYKNHIKRTSDDLKVVYLRLDDDSYIFIDDSFAVLTFECSLVHRQRISQPY